LYHQSRTPLFVPLSTSSGCAESIFFEHSPLSLIRRQLREASPVPRFVLSRGLSTSTPVLFLSSGLSQSRYQIDFVNMPPPKGGSRHTSFSGVSYPLVPLPGLNLVPMMSRVPTGPPLPPWRKGGWGRFHPPYPCLFPFPLSSPTGEFFFFCHSLTDSPSLFIKPNTETRTPLFLRLCSHSPP